jgi:YidC/Oxa1 family membrane protein insertase
VIVDLVQSIGAAAVVANIFQPLIDVANAILKFFHNDVGLTWGLAIIALTVVTRIAILPLSLKQIRSMRSMQAHQPEIKRIQQKYKDDRQRLQRELMTFYQENNINPFASCVPLLLQLPVFMALFYLLRSEDFKNELNGAGWVFIPDLSAKATGGVLVILMILYFVTMIGSTSIMASSAEGNQRIMMYALPVIFTPIVINFPSGLVVYWITTNLWTMGQQWVVKQIIPPPEHGAPEQQRAAKPPPPPPRKKKRRRR